MASGAYAAKTLTVALGSILFHAKSFTYTEGNRTVEVTNADSGGKEEFVLGLESAITGSADGVCYGTTEPIKPTVAVTATLFDGSATKVLSVLITELTVTATIDGGSDISLSFTEGV